MSVVGNPIAASVVAGMAQAPQVSRQKQAQDGQPQHEIRKLRESFQSHMQALDESDSSDSPTHLHIDGELPEHQSPEGKRSRKQPRQGQPDTAELNVLPADTPPAQPSASGSPDDTLYRHLDVII